MINYEELSSPCSSEERALAPGARCKGSSPFRGNFYDKEVAYCD